MTQKPKVSIYYDRECGFCKRSVELIVKFFFVRTREVRPAQDIISVHMIMKEKDSWVITNEAGENFTTFQAGVEIAKCSPVLKWLVPLSRPQFMQRFGEWTYRKVANNRSSIKLP